MIVEQLVRMFVITSFMGIWISKGIKYSCAAAVIGMTIGEIICALYLYIAYVRSSAPLKQNQNMEIHKMSLVKSILKMAVPVAVSSYLQSLLRMIENIQLPLSL